MIYNIFSKGIKICFAETLCIKSHSLRNVGASQARRQVFLNPLPLLLCLPPATSMPCCLWRRTRLFLSHRARGDGNWAYMTISSQFPRMGWRDRADNIQPCRPAVFHPQLAGIQTEDLLPCMGEAERWRRWPLHGLQPLLNTVRSLLNPKLHSQFFPCN